MMKLNLVIPALLVTSFALSQSASASIKLGVVNLQRALQETKKGRTAKAALEKELEDKKKKVDGERATLQKASEEFQKKSAVMSEKARGQKGMEMQQKMAAFQELVQKSQMEIQNREAELTRPILEGLRASVPDLAKKAGVDMVVEENTSGVLYSAERVDMTDDLIKNYDAK